MIELAVVLGIKGSVIPLGIECSSYVSDVKTEIPTTGSGDEDEGGTSRLGVTGDAQTTGSEFLDTTRVGSKFPPTISGD